MYGNRAADCCHIFTQLAYNCIKCGISKYEYGLRVYEEYKQKQIPVLSTGAPEEKKKED